MMSLLPEHEPRPMPFRPQIPVWAPDPAVPLVARLLAYCFAIFMLLTVIRACTMPRPLDYPVMPMSWKSDSINGITLQYPDNWQMVSITETDPVVVTDLQFSYTPPTTDVLQLRVFTLNGQFDEYSEASFIKDHLTAYAPQLINGEDDPADWHTFRATSTLAKTSIQGAWVARVVGNQTVLLLSFAPAAGWRVTQQILSYMCDHLTVAFSDTP